MTLPSQTDMFNHIENKKEKKQLKEIVQKGYCFKSLLITAPVELKNGEVQNKQE